MPQRTLGILLLAASLTVGVPSQVRGQAPTPVAVFVGPNVRDGFVDTDSGVADSIKDVSRELRKNKTLRVVPRVEDAAVLIVIVARRSGPGAGGVALPIGAMTLFAPVQARAIDVILRAGDYERAWTAEDRESDTWTHAARIVARDVATGVQANRERLP